MAKRGAEGQAQGASCPLHGIGGEEPAAGARGAVATTVKEEHEQTHERQNCGGEPADAQANTSASDTFTTSQGSHAGSGRRCLGVRPGRGRRPPPGAAATTTPQGSGSPPRTRHRSGKRGGWPGRRLLRPCRGVRPSGAAASPTHRSISTWKPSTSYQYLTVGLFGQQQPRPPRAAVGGERVGQLAVAGCVGRGRRPREEHAHKRGAGGVGPREDGWGKGRRRRRSRTCAGRRRPASR